MTMCFWQTAMFSQMRVWQYARQCIEETRRICYGLCYGNSYMNLLAILSILETVQENEIVGKEKDYV